MEFQSNPTADWIIAQGINFEAGITCRLKCPGCARTFDPGVLKGGDIYRFDNYKPILDVGYEFVFCGNQSDPIYHPDFLDTIEYLNINSKCLEIATNGSGKTLEWWKKAFSLTNKHSNKGFKTRRVGTEWIFGLDGIPEESHKYRVNQDGVHVWEMMKLGKSMGCEITWQYIVFNYNENDIDYCEQMAKVYGMNFDLIHSTRWWPLTNHLKPSEKYIAERRKVTDGMFNIQLTDIDPITKRIIK